MYDPVPLSRQRGWPPTKRPRRAVLSVPPIDAGNGKAHGLVTGARSLSPDVVRRSSFLSPSLLREVTAVSQDPAPIPAALPLRLSPSKGNIKVKRSSVHQGEGISLGQAPSSEEEGLGGYDQAATGLPHAKKVPHGVPELALGTQTL